MNHHSGHTAPIADFARLEASGTPFCLCRFPGNDQLECFTLSGNRNAQSATFVIQPWNPACLSDRRTYSEGCKLVEPIHLYPWDSLQEITTADDLILAPSPYPNLPPETTIEEYREAFEHFQETFAKSSLRKAILSRIKRVAKPKNFQPFQFFKILEKAYPEAMVYYLFHPDHGRWIGASPEILVEKIDSEWRTMSLAGTQNCNYAPQATWTEKERTEQELVSEHIREALKQSGVSNFYESTPETSSAGNLFHLKSIFKFHHPGGLAFLEKLIGALHPTPAVAGLPTNEAIRLISETERHDRGLYTGYLGAIDFPTHLPLLQAGLPVFPEGKSDRPARVQLYVNLRCMQIGRDSLALYLGGGMTPASDLQSEWDETENKAATLLNHLHDRQ